MSAICKTVRKHRQHGKTFAALLLCILLLLPCGCGGGKKYSVTYIDVFDTVTTFTAYAGSREEFDALAGRLHEQLLEDHRRFDVYREYPGMTNLCTLNRLAGSGEVRVDRVTMDLLTFSAALYEETGGRLNVALGAVLVLWHEAREAAAEDPAGAGVPEESLLREAAEHCRIQDLALDEEACTVRFLDPELKLDVGAVAKGFAQARAMALLDGAGCTAWLLNMGGSVCCRGRKPDGTPWTIGLEDPLDKSRPMRSFPLTDASAVTSGVDQRYFMADGVRYHHIIDPETLNPGDRYTQVTVVLPDPALGDALSTALFLLDGEAGRALAEKYGADVLWMLPEGSQMKTDGFPALK